MTTAVKRSCRSYRKRDGLFFECCVSGCAIKDTSKKQKVGKRYTFDEEPLALKKNLEVRKPYAVDSKRGAVDAAGNAYGKWLCPKHYKEIASTLKEARGGEGAGKVCGGCGAVLSPSVELERLIGKVLCSRCTEAFCSIASQAEAMSKAAEESGAAQWRCTAKIRAQEWGRIKQSIAMNRGSFRSGDERIVAEVYSEYGSMLQSLGSNSVVADIGGNIGAFTCLALAAGAGKVLAFEPWTKLHPVFRKNAAKFAGWYGGDWTLYEGAVVANNSEAASNGSVIFSPPREGNMNSGTGAIRAVRGRKQCSVAATPFAAVAELLPTVIKMDIEGAEFDILAAIDSLPDSVIFFGAEFQFGSKSLTQRDRRIQVYEEIRSRLFSQEGGWAQIRWASHSFHSVAIWTRVAGKKRRKVNATERKRKIGWIG